MPADSKIETAPDASEPASEHPPSETPLEALASTLRLIAIWIFATTFLFQNFFIPSGSMEKTLLVGDHVLVDHVTFAPRTRWAPFVHYRDLRRGDIIVFRKPNPETPDLILVKRLIGLPGDRIRLRHGVVYLNGVARDEPQATMPHDGGDPRDEYEFERDDFPAAGAPPSSLTTESWIQELPSHIVDGDLVVPPGKVFAMGDHRTQSADSRFWGFVPRENILGRPLFNYWSYDAGPDQIDTETATIGARIASFFTTALHFFDRTRWSRTLHLIR